MPSPVATDSPTHHFHNTAEGVLCMDCDSRPGRASTACPAYLDEARAAHQHLARLLLRGLRPAPKTPPPTAPMAEHRAHGYALADWQSELNVRESACRSIGRMFGFDIEPDETLPAMAKR